MSAFKAKMHQIRFPLELRLRPAGGAHSTPRPLTAFKEPILLREEGERGREGKGIEGDGRQKRKEGRKEGRGGSCP